MRRSTVFVMAVLALLLGAMLLAANWMSRGLERDMELGRELTDLFRHRGAVAEGSRVLALLRRGGGEKRLAAKGRGYYLEFVPSERVRSRPGALSELTAALCREVLELRPQERLDWFELRVLDHEGESADTLRALVRLDEGRRLLAAEPPLPAEWRVPRAGPSVESSQRQ